MADYRRLHGVFEQVFDMPEPERSRAVRRLADGDVQLEAEVAALLRDMELASQSRFLSQPLLNDQVFVAGPAGEPSGPKPTVEGYRLLEWLGSGSAGDVYRARSSGPLQRDVAVKILKAGLPPSVVARFHREQRLLASLNHPGVAQVYDAGKAVDGRDYVAVEFVDGPVITRYVAQAQLGWRQQVELIVQASEAVQHIHASGVLHRDLKPANILVSEVDGAPRPKVIDFGAATFLNTNAMLASQHPRFVGTIAYMAPEQLRRDGRPDARSDVYGLGLILLELLLNRHPLDVNTLGLGEVVHRIEHGVLPELPRDLGADRSELTAVIGKACSKRPTDRYPSVQHFADDLQRVLWREPIEARAPSRLFRLRAAVSRRPRTAAVVALLVLLMAALAARLVDVSVRNADQREQMQATLTHLVDDILVQLGELDGALELRADLAAVLLERLRAMPADGQSADMEWLRARVLEGMSDVAMARGDLDRTAELREEVLEIIERLAARAPESAALADAEIKSTIKLGDVWNALGRDESALELYRRAHDRIQRRLHENPDSEDLLDELSWSCERLIPFALDTDLDDAVALSNRRLEVARCLVELSPDNLIHQFGLGCAEHWAASLAQRRGNLEEALAHMTEAIRRLDAIVAAEPHRYWFRSRQVSAHGQYFSVLAQTGDPAADAAGVEATKLARDFYKANRDAELPRRILRTILIRRAQAADAAGDARRAAEWRAEANEFAAATVQQ